MSSYFRNPPICEDADYSWNELEQKIKQEVNESEIDLPPGLRSAVGNEENSNSSHYNSQDEPLPGFVNLAWNGNYNTKASFGQSYPQGVDSHFFGQGPSSQVAQSFGDPKVLKHNLNLASPAYSGKEKISEGIVKHFNQQSFGDHLAQIQEDLSKEGQNASKVQVEEREQKPEQEELEEKQAKINSQEEIQNEKSSIQRQDDSIKENKNKSKEETQEQELKGEDPEIAKQLENSKVQEPGKKSDWGKPLKTKKEVNDEKNRIQQLQKSDEKDSKKLIEDKKLSGKMVAGGDFKSQPEKMPENNRKIENIAGKETNEVNIKSSQTFEKDSDQNKKYTSNSSARNEKKSKKKDVQNNEKTKSQDSWEISKTKTTHLKSEGSFKQDKNKLRPFKTPFGLLMSQNPEDSDESKSRKSSDDDKEIEENKLTEEPVSKENIVEQKNSNLKGDETPKETEQKEYQIDNSKKKKKKNKKKKDISSLADVPEIDKQNEKGSDEDEKEKKNIIESQPEFVEDLDTNKEKSKKKKKKKKPVIERDDEKVDPTKVNKQMEQKEGTSKSFAVGAGKDSANKEPFLERLLFVPPVGYYDYLVSLMNIKDSKKQKKE